MCNVFLFSTDSPTTEIYTYCHTPALHDALPSYSSLWRNQLDDACRYAQAAMEHPLDTAGSTVEGLDPRVTSLAHLSWAYWRMNRISDALAVSRQSVELAQLHDSHDTLCFALAFAAMLHRFLGNPETDRKRVVL